MWSVHLTDLSSTRRLAQALAAELPRGSVLTLRGNLGAGKTFFVQCLAEAWGIPRGVATSPTFVLAQRYQGERPLYHVDAYRLRDVDEALELGLEEHWNGQEDVCVEWPERLAELLPPQRLEIDLEVQGPTARQATLNAVGEVYLTVLVAVRKRFKT